MTFNRRTFMNGISASIAAFGSLGLSSSTSFAQLIDKNSDWKSGEFDSMLKNSARAKQVCDVRPIGDGKFLNNLQNWLNGFHFGFNIPEDQIKLVAALHGPSNMLNFDDSMWEKYRLGEWPKVDDPKTGKPAVRNIFSPRNAPHHAAAVAWLEYLQSDQAQAAYRDFGFKSVTRHQGHK